MAIRTHDLSPTLTVCMRWKRPSIKHKLLNDCIYLVWGLNWFAELSPPCVHWFIILFRLATLSFCGFCQALSRSVSRFGCNFCEVLAVK